jgi:hypothetical protein
MDFAPRLELDPLIAEAKQRMRRRRLGLAAAALAAVALAVGLSIAMRPANSGSRSGAAANSTELPRLQDAFALGTFVRLNRASAVAVFRIKCGWHYTPRRKIRPGLWRVSLRGLKFGEYGYARGNFAGGTMNEMSSTQWERFAGRPGWSGSLRLGERSGYIADGPTTDICGGVSG